MPTCVILAAQMDGRSITTVEAFDNGPGAALDPIQQAFAETGAIQCGFCTPAMVLAARQLLSAEPNPTEAQVARRIGRRPLPLHRLCQAGGGGPACGRDVAR